MFCIAFFIILWFNIHMSNTKRWGLVGFEAFFGLLALFSLVSENIGSAVRGGYDPLNLWSHFTYQSNLIAVIALLTSSYYLWKHKESTKLDWFRGAATLYMIITGVVYATLLNNGNPVFWFNDPITHIVIPIAITVAWFVHQPSQRIEREGSWGTDMWLAYPLAFAAYTQLYGHFIHPGDFVYGFLDPTGGNELHVVGMIAGLLVAAWFVSQVLRYVPRKQFVPVTAPAS